MAYRQTPAVQARLQDNRSRILEAARALGQRGYKVALAEAGRAFGGRGVSVSDRAGLRAALEEALIAPVFTVIAVEIDRKGYDGLI